jgi:glycosyltransferase
MSLQASQISIAITVFDRREFIEHAVASALNQTIPVKVMVVEDCGPDPTLQAFVKSKFGARIDYIRNRERLGLFGNWNACIENCKTPWLSILHDDDYFKPAFVETMLKLQSAAPGRGLYFGSQLAVDSKERVVPFGKPVVPGFWQEIELRTLADRNLLGFAGHLFAIENARAVGGFRNHSRFCGDWEMWFKLVSRYGGAHTGAEVAVVRVYEDWRKGTSKVSRAGENCLATVVQRKRNFAYLKKSGQVSDIDRKALRGASNISLHHMIWYGADFSPRKLNYNIALFLAHAPSSARQFLVQVAIWLLGPGFVKIASRFCRLWHRST